MRGHMSGPLFLSTGLKGLKLTVTHKPLYKTVHYNTLWYINHTTTISNLHKKNKLNILLMFYSVHSKSLGHNHMAACLVLILHMKQPEFSAGGWSLLNWFVVYLIYLTWNKWNIYDGKKNMRHKRHLLILVSKIVFFFLVPLHFLPPAGIWTMTNEKFSDCVNQTKFKKAYTYVLSLGSLLCLHEANITGMPKPCMHGWQVCINFSFVSMIDSAIQGAQTNRDYVVRKMSDEIHEIIRVLQLTTYDEEEWDADDLAIMKKAQVKFKSEPEVIKLFFMLNSAENEICSAYKKLNTINLNFLPAQQNWAWFFFC